MCLSVMRFFSLKVFPFLISVWLMLSFCCVHFHSFVQFYWGSGRCTNEFALECFVSIKLSQIGSFHELLVLATECFFSFEIFEIHSGSFLGFYCVVGMLKVQWSTKLFLILVFFVKNAFFVFILDAIFLWYNFFHFSGNFVASYVIFMCSLFIVVPFSSSTGLAIVAEANLRCGDFLSEKFVTLLAVFLSFWF